MVMNMKGFVLFLMSAFVLIANGSNSSKKRQKCGRLMNVWKFGLGLLCLNCAALTGNTEIHCPGQSMEVIKAAELPCGADYSWIAKEDTPDTSFCSCLQKCEKLKDCVAISLIHNSSVRWCQLHSKIGIYSNDPQDLENWKNFGKKEIDASHGCYHVLRQCPTSFPPNAQLMMNYIRCSDEAEQSEFFDKYLTSDKTAQPCSMMQVLYKKTKQLGKCISKGSSNMVENAKARILGCNISHEAHVEMFEDYLATLEDIGTKEALELVEIVEKIKDFDFFRMKGLQSFDQPQSALNIKWILENYAWNFDRVDEVASLLKRLVQKNAEEPLNAEDMAFVFKNMREPWIQQARIKYIEHLVKDAESFPNKKLAWEMKVRRLKKKYDL